MIGEGKVAGSFSTVSLANGSVVEESPWRVNGRSLRMPISDGSNSIELSARRADFIDTSRAGAPFLGGPSVPCAAGAAES